MSKKQFVYLIVSLLCAYIAMYAFLINVYVVTFFLTLFYAYEIKRDHREVNDKITHENEELMNEIKTTTQDAYLKQKQLLTMVSNIPSPLMLLNEYGEVAIYNSHFNLFRNSIEEIKMDYINNDCVEPVAHFIKDAFIFERKFKKVIEVDGKTYNAICIPVTTNTKFSGCVILFQDISEAKEKEALQKMFIADASHELKTPISVIKGMIEILNREDFDDEQTKKEFLVQIDKETKRLEFIVRDLLQLSRLSMNELILKKEFIKMSEIIERSMNSFQVLANKKGIRLEKQFKEDITLNVDEELMITLFNNLISNAIKYSDHGKVCVTMEIENEHLIISIQDEGVGLSQEDCNRIFERFYRVDKARSRNSGGSGLGLSIVRSICEAHQASVSVKSKLGVGTTFKIKFKVNTKS